MLLRSPPSSIVNWMAMEKTVGPWKVGDVVRLKSDGAPMAIAELLQDDQFWCVWHDHSGAPQSQSYRREVLTKWEG